VESQGKVMSLFDPAATAKSVHDTIDDATTALPSDAKYALIVDATVRDGDRPKVQGYLVGRGAHGWQTVIGGAWDGEHVEGRAAVMKVWK
jgi:hypothetical protein